MDAVEPGETSDDPEVGGVERGEDHRTRCAGQDRYERIQSQGCDERRCDRGGGDHRDRSRTLRDADEGGDEERHKEGWQADRGNRLGESVTDAGLTQYESEASAGTGDEQDESRRGRPVSEPSLDRDAGGHTRKRSIR